MGAVGGIEDQTDPNSGQQPDVVIVDAAATSVDPAGSQVEGFGGVEPPTQAPITDDKTPVKQPGLRNEQ